MSIRVHYSFIKYHVNNPINQFETAWDLTKPFKTFNNPLSYAPGAYVNGKQFRVSYKL